MSEAKKETNTTNNKQNKQDKQEKKFRPKTAAAPNTEPLVKDVKKIEEAKEVKEEKPQREQQTPRGDKAGQRDGDKAGRGDRRGGKGKEGGQRENQRNKNDDKDSWIWKFHNLKRPEYPRLVITPDVEIPAMPTKDEMLKLPSKETFEEDMNKLDNKIQELRTHKQDLINKRREVIDGGKMKGSSMTYREVLSSKVTEMKVFNEQKKALNNNVKKVNEDLDVLENEKRNLFKSLSQDVDTEDKINDTIRTLEFKLKNTTFKSSNEENKIIKEMQNLKNLVPQAKRCSDIKPTIEAKRKIKTGIYAELTEVKKVIQGREGEIEKLRKEMEVMKEGQNDIKSKGDEITLHIDKTSANINEQFVKKDKLRDDYFHARYDYEVQRDFIYYVQSNQTKKDGIKEREGDIKLEQDRRAQQIKDLPHPYAKELETCSHLEARCHQLKKLAGLEVDSEVAAKQLQEQQLKEVTQAKLEGKLSDGKIQAYESKDIRESNAMFQVGGGKKQKGKKQKKVEYEDIFSMDIMTIQKFALIGISPPTDPPALDKKLEEIEAKKKWYEENGASALQTQIDDLVKQQKLLEENEREQTRKEKLAAQEEEEKEAEQPQRRGGRGRGGRGGRGAQHGGHHDDRRDNGRGGAGRGTREPRENPYRQKSEFEGEDDDNVYSAPVRPQQKKNPKQTQQDLQLNEDNYPTF